MRSIHSIGFAILLFCPDSMLGQEGVNVRVGSQVGVNTTADGVRIRLIVDQALGRIRYLAIGHELTKQSESQTNRTTLVPIAIAKFVPGKEHDTVVLSTNSTQLQQAPRVTLNGATTPGYTIDWTKSVNAFFNVKPVSSSTSPVKSGRR